MHRNNDGHAVGRLFTKRNLRNGSRPPISRFPTTHLVDAIAAHELNGRSPDEVMQTLLKRNAALLDEYDLTWRDYGNLGISFTAFRRNLQHRCNTDPAAFRLAQDAGLKLEVDDTAVVKDLESLPMPKPLTYLELLQEQNRRREQHDEIVAALPAAIDKLMPEVYEALAALRAIGEEFTTTGKLGRLVKTKIGGWTADDAALFMAVEAICEKFGVRCVRTKPSNQYEVPVRMPELDRARTTVLKTASY